LICLKRREGPAPGVCFVGGWYGMSCEENGVRKTWGVSVGILLRIEFKKVEFWMSY
jgi:hypothetical protein